MGYDSDDLLLLTAVALALKKKQTKQKRRKKRVWMQECLQKRHECSQENLLSDLRLTSAADYSNFLQMDAETFDELLRIITPKIKKKNTNMRNAISTRLRLSVTLRYLATGHNFHYLMQISAISSHAIGNIVRETCEALIISLAEYIKVPKSEEKWKVIANNFYTSWNFPNCLGAIDGKHIAIKKPAKNSSLYYNYKGSFSVVLMAVVNANYEFIVADVGTNGRISDGGVLERTAFGKALANNSLNIPHEEKLPLSENISPYVFIGGNAFETNVNSLKPYEQVNLTKKQRIFNYRLNRARRIVENTFGILFSKFGVLQTTITLAPEKARTIILTCCYLHNFLHSKRIYFTRDLVDFEDVDSGVFTEGSWRARNSKIDLQPTTLKTASNTTECLHDLYADYFCDEGKVPWQNKCL